MKIAICLSGEPRDFLLTGGNLIKKLSKHKVDFFMHSYLNYGTKSNLPLFVERGGEEYQQSFEILPTPNYLDMVRPVKALVEEYSSTETAFSFNKNQSLAQRMFSMFYGIENAFRLVGDDYYDIIVRVRADLFLSSAIDWEDIYIQLIQDDKKIFIPKLYVIHPDFGPWEYHNRFVTDLFWIASGTKINLFQNIFSDQKRLCSPELHSNPERSSPGDWIYESEWFLKKWLDYYDFHVCPLEIKMVLGRQIRLLRGPENQNLISARAELGID